MVNNRISVIVPIYNVEAYLERCVNSICRQTYTDLEIILVDDGAKDACPQMCDRFAETDSRIMVIHKPNGGLSDARNAGIEAASGEYLLFVDADDYIAPEMCEKLLFALRDNHADISICNILCVGSLSEEFERFNHSLPFRNEIISGREKIEEKIFESPEWYWVVAWNKLYRRDLLETVRFQKGKMHEDEFIFHEIFSRCQCIACVEDALYYYEQRAGSITQSSFKVQRLDGAEALFRRAKALMQMEYSRKSVYLAIVMAINVMNRIFDYGLADKEEYRRRYSELLQQYRSIGLKQLMKNSDGLLRKAKLLAAYFSPRLLWKRHS